MTSSIGIGIALAPGAGFYPVIVAGFLLPGLVLLAWGAYMLRTRELLHATPGFFVWLGYIQFAMLGFYANLERYGQYSPSDFWQASLLLAAGLLMFIWGYYSAGNLTLWYRKIQPQPFFSGLPQNLSRRLGFILAFCLGSAGILSMMYIVSLVGGPIAFLKLPYGADVLNLRNLTVVDKMALFILQTFLPGATTLSIAILVRGGCSRVQRLLLWVFLMSFLLYGLMSKIRGYIISPFLSYIFLRMALPDRAFRRSEIPKLFFIAFSALFIAYVIGEARKVEGGLFSIIEGPLAGQGDIREFIGGTFDHYYWLIDVMREIPSQRPLLFGWTLISPFLTLVPRDVWANKPYGFGKLVLVWQGVPFESPVSTGTLLITELYANFWVPGTLILMFIQGRLCAKLYRFFLKHHREPIAASLYLTLIGCFAMVRGDFHSGATASIYKALGVFIPAWIIYRGIKPRPVGKVVGFAYAGQSPASIPGSLKSRT
ncbi:MAG: O-antigen polymerase [Candidatus Methanomethylicaceae archaeon]